MSKIKAKQVENNSITQNKIFLSIPISSTSPASVDYVKSISGNTLKYSIVNLDMVALITDTDGDLACDTAILNVPISVVTVNVNGLLVNVGSGTTASCFFSGDNGSTKRNIGDEQQGDKLYWVGSVSGYELASDDIIDFIYLK
jgi:hypothetical protein